MYLKDDCELCKQALELVRPFERAGRLALELVDIAADPELLRRYGITIPVLEIDGRQSLEWPFVRSDVQRALR